MTRLGIHGAAGRMGQRLVALAADDENLAVLSAIDASGHPAIGQDSGVHAGANENGVILSDLWPDDPIDVFIDFSVPKATRSALESCLKLRTSMIIGTTGLQPDDHARIDRAGESIAVLQAPNMSLGVNFLLAAVRQAAQTLGDDYDIEIVEAHHRYKVDAPSGTAAEIARTICAATNRSMSEDVVYGRHGKDALRAPGQIGVHALRTGDLAGRHTVSFGTSGEELQFTHVASTRDIFAHGALSAAKWLCGKPPGRYQIADVLGL